MTSINDQIKCVRREIAMRERVYPKWVANARMSVNKARQEIETMKAVERTLMDVANNSEFKLE